MTFYATTAVFAALFLSKAIVSVMAQEDHQDQKDLQPHARLREESKVFVPDTNVTLSGTGIVDGTQPLLNEYPWFALMQGSYICGG